jgi:CheY-like chemotaxis protein
MLPPTFRTPSVLVVDDLDDAADSLATLLEMSGFPARAVTSGEAALAAVAADPPDVVILDLLMPGTDGWEVARRLRAGGPAGRPLLVALTGCDGREDRRRAAEAGIDVFLLKPIEPAALVATLTRLNLPADMPLARAG